MFRACLSLLASLFLLAGCSRAEAGPLVDIAVVDRDTGQWLPTYPHRGDHWVAGEPGHRYAVRLTNTTGERVLVVLSVDGVNAVTGETAAPSQAGYVLDPWETTEITGWRKSLDDVARFVFTDKGDSYAARTGRARNVGVIGVAAFREARAYYRTPPPIAESAPYPPHAGARSEAAEASAASPEASSARDAAASRQRTGTGHGEREWAPVGSTRFVRARHTPDQISQIRYDEPRRLVALGILPPPYRRLHREPSPQAFPGGFVADPPPRWR